MTDTITEPQSSLVQVTEICPHCNKSFYRRNNKCYACGEHAPPPVESLPIFDRSNHACHGKTWDSKLHRYVFNKG
jgi:predicted amidophosphoribosyltransferase